MNVLTATGNLGKDAVTRNAGGTDVAGFSIAMKSGYGDKAQTIWIDCSYWGKAGAAAAQYLTKGKQVTVTGEMGTREHEGKTYITLRVDRLTFGQGKDDQAAPRTEAPAQQQAPRPASAPAFGDDDAPF